MWLRFRLRLITVVRAFWFRVSAGPLILRQYGALHGAGGNGLSGRRVASSGAVPGFRYQLRIGRISFPLQFPPAGGIPAFPPDPYAMLETGLRRGL